MVNIKLDSKITLTSDCRNWILSSNGKAFGFFGTLSPALQSYLDMKLKDSDCTSIQALLTRQKLIVDSLNQVLAVSQIRVIPNLEVRK